MEGEGDLYVLTATVAFEDGKNEIIVIDKWRGSLGKKDEATREGILPPIERIDFPQQLFSDELTLYSKTLT